ncbi:MAG: GNAT family N-acetyltransferase, partial [Inquilinus sp.]|nr:GNAT family N-acetyltransferase [Inquilinus sp.]
PGRLAGVDEAGGVQRRQERRFQRTRAGAAADRTLTAMALRGAGPLEAPLLAALNAACFVDTGEPPWNERAFADLLAAPGVEAWLSLAEGTTEPVAGFGLIRVAGGEAEILSIGVLPENRRQGHGAVLLNAAVGAAARAGATALFLEVAEDNLPAVMLYTAGGFAAVGRRRRYYRRVDGAVDAILMRRTLDGISGGVS